MEDIIMNILETIVEHKKSEIEFRKSRFPEPLLKREAFYSRQTFSLKSFLMDSSRTGIIAEFKRISPQRESSMNRLICYP
jgi:indole-3-glycerol phosphate synthase